jgi:hypothetical protein
LVPPRIEFDNSRAQIRNGSWDLRNIKLAVWVWFYRNCYLSFVCLTHCSTLAENSQSCRAGFICSG